MGWKKTVWSAVDRFVFIGVGVLGTIATAYITGYMKLQLPELVVTQSYNEVDASNPVNTAGLGLTLNYDGDAEEGFGVYRVDFGNRGIGAEEDLRLQIKFPAGISAVYYTEPDFRVFRPGLMEFKAGEFYLELPEFPPNARGWVTFKIEGEKERLDNVWVKAVGKNGEGRVNPLK